MAWLKCDFPIQVRPGKTDLYWYWWCYRYMYQLEMVDQTANFSDPKSCEILRSNSCDLARPVAIISKALQTEATGRWYMRLRAATWRWSRCCWPRAPPRRRRMTMVRGPQRLYQCDRTDIVGRWCNRRHVKEMRHDIEVVVPFTTSSFEESSMDFR